MPCTKADIVQAFEKIEVQNSDDPTKKGFQWRLSEQALRDGRVQSTTRFRNKQPNKRGSKSHNPAPHRQASGARGGEMARRAAVVRRSERLRENHRSLSAIRTQMVNQGLLVGPGSEMHTNGGGFNSASPTFSPMEYVPTNGHSGSASPYFFNDENVYTSHQHLDIDHSPASLGNDSYPSSPGTDMTAGGPDIHFYPIGDHLFYGESPESGSEPRTPGAFSDAAHMDLSPFTADFSFET